MVLDRLMLDANRRARLYANVIAQAQAQLGAALQRREKQKTRNGLHVEVPRNLCSQAGTALESAKDQLKGSADQCTHSYARMDMQAEAELGAAQQRRKQKTSQKTREGLQGPYVEVPAKTSIACLDAPAQQPGQSCTCSLGVSPA